MAIAVEALSSNPLGQVEREPLLAALAEAMKVQGKATPITAGVRLTMDTAAQTLTIEATDLTAFYRRTIPAWVTEDGTTCVPTRILRDIVRGAPKKATIGLHGQPDTLHATFGERSLTIAVLPVADFPMCADTPVLWAEAPGAMGAQGFAGNLADVAACACRDEDRPVLAGVLLEHRDGEAHPRIVSTDSYRLALISDGSWRRVERNDEQLLIPGSALTLFAKMVGKYTGPMSLHVSALPDVVTYARRVDTYRSYATLAAGSASLTVRLIEGRFPDYRTLIPHSLVNGKAPTEIRWDVRPAVQSLDALAAIIPGTTPVKVNVADTGAISVTAKSTGTAEVNESLLTCQGAGDALLVGFNPRFLADGLRFPGSDIVVMGAVDEGRPVLIDCPGTGKGERLYLLMPVRLWT